MEVEFIRSKLWQMMRERYTKSIKKNLGQNNFDVGFVELGFSKPCEFVTLSMFWGLKFKNHTCSSKT